MTNYLACHTIKVAYHGSMHSSPLDVYEKMSPNLAVISTRQESSSSAGVGTRNLFPHDSSVLALKECKADILTTDGSYEASDASGVAQEGSIVIAIPPGGRPHWRKYNDDSSTAPAAPTMLNQP